MTMIRTTGFLAGTITLAFSSIAGAADSTTSIDSLRAELNELRSQNEALAARVDAQDSEWLNEERAGEVRSLVQDVLADSQSRTSLQDSGMMAGYKAGKGFYLSNQDGSFSLMMSGQLQARWVMNNNTSRAGSETQWGFQVRRAKVRFQGNVVDPSWTYMIEGSFDGPTNLTGQQTNAGSFEFQDAYIAKELENGLSLTFGQFKTPWMREELVDSSQQLAVERSTINEFYGQDRAVGIMASYATDSWNFAASYNNGQRTAVSAPYRYTNFTNNQADWAVSGRFEYKFSVTGATSTASPAPPVTKKPSWSVSLVWVRSTVSRVPLTVSRSGASPQTSPPSSLASASSLPTCGSPMMHQTSMPLSKTMNPGAWLFRPATRSTMSGNSSRAMKMATPMVLLATSLASVLKTETPPFSPLVRTTSSTTT